MKKLATTFFICISATILYAQKPFEDGNGKYGLKDNNGNIIIPGRYDRIDTFSTDGLARIRVGIKYGFIDGTGKEIVMPKYFAAWGFSEGLAAVAAAYENGTAWLYIDKTGKEVIHCKKGRIAGPFYGGLAKIIITPETGTKIGFIDKTGNEVVTPKYDAIGFFSEGMLAVELGNKWGYIDSTGKEVIPCKYDYTGPFSRGWAHVMADGKMEYIDKTGKIL